MVKYLRARTNRSSRRIGRLLSDGVCRFQSEKLFPDHISWRRLNRTCTRIYVRFAPLNYSADEFRKFRRTTKGIRRDEEAHACLCPLNPVGSSLNLIDRSTGENWRIIADSPRESSRLVRYSSTRPILTMWFPSINFKSSFRKNRMRTGCPWQTLKRKFRFVRNGVYQRQAHKTEFLVPFFSFR